MAETKKLKGVWAGPMVAADLKVGQVVRDRMSSFHPPGRVTGWTVTADGVEVSFHGEHGSSRLPVEDLDLYVEVGGPLIGSSEGTVTP